MNIYIFNDKIALSFNKSQRTQSAPCSRKPEPIFRGQENRKIISEEPLSKNEIHRTDKRVHSDSGSSGDSNIKLPGRKWLAHQTDNNNSDNNHENGDDQAIDEQDADLLHRERHLQRGLHHLVCTEFYLKQLADPGKPPAAPANMYNNK